MNCTRLTRLASLVALALLATAGFAWLPTASASTTQTPWEEGLQGHPFHLLKPVSSAVRVAGSSDQRLELDRGALTDLGPDARAWDDFPAGERPDPRMAYPLEDGHVLISGGKEVAYVKEVDADGAVVWEYRNGADGLLRRPFSAEPATFGGKACVLISDRIACRVFAVTRDSAKEVVWQYGTTDTPGSGVDQLADPFCATQIPPAGGQTDGNVLIADSNDNHRVIEIRSDDYDVAAADSGYTPSSIVWQYGVTGKGGSAPGYLNQARSPQRLPNGDTLITDAAGRRVIEVRSSDYDPSKADNGYTASSIVWSYTDGIDGTLQDPNTARYVTTGSLAGSVVITDCGKDAQWVRIIDHDTKDVEETLNLRTFQRPDYVGSTDVSSPRDARVDAESSLWIADAGFGRVLQVGNEEAGTVTSDSLDCGKPSMVKAFTRLTIGTPPQAGGTSLAIWYSVDGQEFVKASISSDGNSAFFPAGTTGKRFAYRIALTSSDRWSTPVFEGMTIHFTEATSGDSGGGGGGSGGTGNSGQSGVYVYPTTAEGGSGVSGSGSGSGASGSGSGSGSGSSGAGAAGTGTGAVPSSTAQALDVPVQSTGSGEAQAVQGYQVQGEEGVSGVPLRAEQGAQAPEPQRPGPSLPVLALVAAGVVVAAAFFMPWPFVAAHMRRITDFDHVRPTRILPFRPLDR